MDMALPIVNATTAVLARVSAAFNAPLARAVVFGVHIDGHLVVEGLLIAVIVFQLSRKSYKPPKKPLSEKEVDELCDEWEPEPLCPPIKEGSNIDPPILESAAGPHTTIEGKEVVNFASANYLGLIGNEKIIDSCVGSLEKYGVGSCGPRGFYGTIDVHLDCEAKIANFLGTPDSILYSYGISTIFSVIPAFCKKGDIIVADEGVHWAVQNGLYLSRSTVVYFKHNDMASLASTLEKLTRGNKRTEKIRRYIVVESIYQNSGQISPLDEIVKLKEKYLFRVILEESHSFGVLGKSGRGLAEHYGVPIDKIDIITAGMGNALATDGGFCTGSARVVDHQRLSSAGYVFSASLPPYLASAAVSAVNYLEENPSVLANLRSNVALLHTGLSDTPGLEISSHVLSPIVFLKLKKSTGSLATDIDLLETIAEQVLKEDSVFIVASKRSSLDRCKLPVGIRLFVSASHTELDISKACSSLKRISASVLSDHV
ncbi:long chain base biosynthesis protein 1a [Hordeum vulgare subsp. vulgare]|uniref:serine C-palmitoyltransferase n=1 Tax=Hordeum vulgare subsp. vulgare TaxID=112509 RepID=M0X0G4_HORVV|nr:long chain base biosynthesis protein 1a [Hordeum vulgare subsp. vulgare]XP_044982175.1 long chain base biosynthesis protein 1a [Hordeum vulgare subsp. vulgare]XP_044982176.1 long chain base biosynthesis protein 1a [Hordeum vulgare subsp. vulgare]XP_044982177.1 long chain base biosynthesis protein 1a [Hordeum vulgare subsp. vulgare]